MASVLGALSVGPTSNTETTIAVFGGVVVVALAALTNRALRTASMVAGVAALASVYALVKIQQAKADAGEWGSLIQPGWGLYLTILVGLYLIASTWIVRRRRELATA